MSATPVRDLGAAVTRAMRQFVPELAEDVSPTALLEEIGVDSMTLVDVVLELQEEYSVEFPDDALADIHAVQDLVVVLNHLVALGGSPDDAG